MREVGHHIIASRPDFLWALRRSNGVRPLRAVRRDYVRDKPARSLSPPWPEMEREEKMLKMQDDPAMFIKTQGRATECRPAKGAFSIKLDRCRHRYGRFSSLAENNLREKGGHTKYGPRRRCAGKRILFSTFEAGMSMKTKDRKTQCPNESRHYSSSFTTFTSD